MFSSLNQGRREMGLDKSACVCKRERIIDAGRSCVVHLWVRLCFHPQHTQESCSWLSNQAGTVSVSWTWIKLLCKGCSSWTSGESGSFCRVLWYERWGISIKLCWHITCVSDVWHIKYILGCWLPSYVHRFVMKCVCDCSCYIFASVERWSTHCYTRLPLVIRAVRERMWKGISADGRNVDFDKGSTITHS